MSDPKNKKDEELDLDAETVEDLEPDEKNAEDVQGGSPRTAMTACAGCRQN